jgi:hypothetical protein
MQMSKHQAQNCILSSEELHQSCPNSGSTQQRRFNEIVQPNDANQLIYSVDVQHQIRKNSIQIFNRPSGK